MTGATVRDASGTGHDATLEGKDGQLPQVVPSPCGQALKLDKDKGHGLRVNAAPDLVGTDGLTVMAWVRPDTTRGHLAVLANKGDRVPGRPATGYRLSVFYNAVFAELGFGDADGVRLTTPEWSLAEGYWAHIAMTFDGQTLTLYINTTEAARLRLPEPRRLTPGPEKFTIGKYYWNDAYPFTGLLADVRIYTRALTAEQVLAAACEALDRGRQQTPASAK